MNIKELYDKRASLWEDMKDFLNTHTQANGTMTAEDAAAYERMEADMKSLSDQIERMQRLTEMEDSMKQPANSPIIERPMNGGEVKTGRASDEYRKGFEAYLRGRSIGNELSPMVEGTPSSAGYLVPIEFERRVIDALAEQNVIRSVANVIRTANDRKIPVALTHGEATWMGEGAAYIETKPTFDQLTLSAFKLGRMTTISEEMLQDAMINVEQFLQEDIVRSFATAEESAFCTGDGTNGPTGIFTASGGQVGVTSAKAGEISADDLISLVYALRIPYRRNAKFLMKDATVAAIRKLKDGNGVYMWQPAMTNGQPDRLMGYDLLTTAYAPDIAAGALSVAFGDFKYFWIADRMGMTVQRLNERYADFGLVGFRATERCDGKVVLPEAIQILKMKA